MRNKFFRVFFAIVLAALAAVLLILVICLYGTTLAIVPAVGCFWAFVGALAIMIKEDQ